MFIALIVVASWASLNHGAIAQERFVELQVVSVGFGELGVQQQVMEMLSKVGADRVSSKSTRAATRPDIIETESRGTTHVLVVAVLDGRTLRLPGGKYSIRDAARIKDFIQELRDDGASVTLAEKQAFGLTGPQLVAVFDELSAEVRESTKGRSSKQVFAELARGVLSEITLTPKAQRLLGPEPILEEMQGLSTGTAMAAILRPLGLVLTPIRRQGEKVRFSVAASTEVEEHWPVGWPIETSPGNAEPKVFERLDDVSIENFVLKDALDAIEGRVGVPFLYDQNGIARAGVELDQTKVTVRGKRMKYFLVAKKMLVQTKPKLGIEIRKDENGKSFLWISPLNAR